MVKVGLWGVARQLGYISKVTGTRSVNNTLTRNHECKQYFDLEPGV